MPVNYNFIATAVGSLPHNNADKALAAIYQAVPEMPFWPQLANVSPMEDMLLMYARMLGPLLTPNLKTRSLEPLAPGMEREEALAVFYQNLWEGDGGFFLMEANEASAFKPFCARLPATGSVKGQVTGPITMASAIIGVNGKALLFDEDISEAIARGLGACAGEQAKALAVSGAGPVIFFDEPSLTGFGSAFSPLTREHALSLLRSSLEEARSRCPEAAYGIHCCGNTDWSLIIEAGPEIISLDAVGFGSYLLLYAEQVKNFIEKGGSIAWGAVPTDPGQAVSAVDLWNQLYSLLLKLLEHGIKQDALTRASLITPACGLGSLSEKDAEYILSLLQPLSLLAREWAWSCT